MSSLSISFTLGKASTPNTVNINHNNRKFLAKNIDAEMIKENVIFKQIDVEDAYHSLFDDAVDEYNNKQKQKCRRITNYYDDMCKNKKTEAFYEAIVQFGDIDTASCSSAMGEQCKKMLCEYMEDFQKRNPNLYVFNSVLHMDEATPHLHIDFIPFYTKQRTNGLSKGVSMKSALEEQGFSSPSRKNNCFVAFEEQERNAMEALLNAHGIERDVKHAYYDHMTVDEYKDYKVTNNMNDLINDAFNVKSDKLNITAMKLELEKQRSEIAMLKKEKASPFMSFYYNDSEKQLFVQRELDKQGIEYRETENGFDAKKIYLQDIRRIENSFTPEKENYRDKLRDDIDRAVIKSQNINELINYLQQLHYEVKQGKYISARPPQSERFIRFKSLGEFYSEEALRNRIIQRQGYEADIERQIQDSKKKNTNTIVLTTTVKYFQAFVLYDFSMKKVRKDKPFTWKNDAVLDNLASINKRINEGATLDTFRSEFDAENNKVRKLEDDIAKYTKDLDTYNKVYKCACIIYGDAKANSQDYDFARQIMELYPKITKENFHLMPQASAEERKNIDILEKELQSARASLKEKSDTLTTVEKIMGESFIQSIMNDELMKRASEFLPNELLNNTNYM